MKELIFNKIKSIRTEQEVTCFLKSIFLATRAMMGEYSLARICARSFPQVSLADLEPSPATAEVAQGERASGGQ